MNGINILTVFTGLWSLCGAWFVAREGCILSFW